MRCLSVYALGLLAVLSAAADTGSVIVPGKAFDRFITIWLENQVRHTIFSSAPP
jgi:hypothetical protein